MAIRMAGKGLTDFLGVKPAYGDIGGQGIVAAAEEAQTIAYGNAQTTNAMLKGMADIQAAEHYGEAAAAQGAEAGRTNAVGGFTSGIGGLSSFMPKGGLFGGGGSPVPKASDFNLSGSQFSPGGLFG